VILEVLFGTVAIILLYILLLKYRFNNERDLYIDNEIVRLRQETQALTNNIGGLEMLLGSKEKELSELARQKQEYKDLLDQELQKNKSIISQKKSSEIRTGFIAEQLAPYMMPKYDPKNIKFIGAPIDMIIFCPDEIVFLEVKTGGSHLSFNQKRIRQLVQQRKVRWEEFRLRNSRSNKNDKSN